MSATLPRCQTWTDEDMRCGAPATFIVKGLPGNPWSGPHCDEHALSCARLFAHQGGCVLVPLGEPENGRCSEHSCTADDPVPPELHPGSCPHDDGRGDA